VRKVRLFGSKPVAVRLIMAKRKVYRAKRKGCSEAKVHLKRVYLPNDATCEGRKTNPFSPVYSASCASQFTVISYSSRRVPAVGIHSIPSRRGVRAAAIKDGLGLEMETRVPPQLFDLAYGGRIMFPLRAVPGRCAVMLGQEKLVHERVT
jgi:hypothetical protein